MTIYTYDQEYLSFLSGTLFGPPALLVNDFWDWTATTSAAPEQDKFAYALFHGFENIGQETLYIKVNGVSAAVLAVVERVVASLNAVG